MLKIKHVLNMSCGMKSRDAVINTRSVCNQKSYFVSDDEIMENVLGQFLAIGINLGDTKNVLTETALEKLRGSIENFERNDEIHVAVLHGIGGNFCTGMVPTDNAKELSQSLMKTLHTAKKPIIGSLDGYVLDFGLHLAVMCDIRIMDKSALAGLKGKEQNLEIPSFMCERLLLTIGLARTAEFMCSRQTWTAAECLTMGLANKLTEPGCALGQSIALAQNIAFNNPQKSIAKKLKIMSFLKTKAD